MLLTAGNMPLESVKRKANSSSDLDRYGTKFEDEYGRKYLRLDNDRSCVPNFSNQENECQRDSSFNLKNNVECNVRYYESIISNLKAMHQVEMEKKSLEFESMSKLCRTFKDTSTVLDTELRKCSDENRILKKAVSTLDGRCKELAVMNNAKEAAINDLEEKNRYLEEQYSNLLNAIKATNFPESRVIYFSGSFPPNPPNPPDVF